MTIKFNKYTWSDGSKSKATCVFDNDMASAELIAKKLQKQGYKTVITIHENGIIDIQGRTAPRPRMEERRNPCGDGCGISYGR